MKIVQAYKKAAKRERMVKEAKWKNAEDLTREEAIEIVKWDEESRRNTAIGLAVIVLNTLIIGKIVEKGLERSE